MHSIFELHQSFILQNTIFENLLQHVSRRNFVLLPSNKQRLQMLGQLHHILIIVPEIPQNQLPKHFQSRIQHVRHFSNRCERIFHNNPLHLPCQGATRQCMQPHSRSQRGPVNQHLRSVENGLTAQSISQNCRSVDFESSARGRPCRVGIASVTHFWLELVRLGLRIMTFTFEYVT